MNRELKTKWVKALRSGRYKQSDGYLYKPSEDGYCCLGVLCMVNGASKKLIQEHGYPEDVEGQQRLIRHDIAKELARMNDEGVPFEMTAGFIEAVL